MIYLGVVFLLSIIWKVQKKLEEVSEGVQEMKEDVVETAQEARVPVPSTSLPYIGFIHSLTIKDVSALRLLAPDL